LGRKRKTDGDEPPAAEARGAAFHHLTVAITGAAVMVIEVLGTRLIAPFYGVGLFVWTALLSVALVSLAVGYRVGGRLADRRGPGLLAPLIAGAALMTALIPLVRPAVLRMTDPLGLRLGSLTAALVLFGGPLTLLGMVGPCVVRIRALRLDSVGSTAGGVFAVSTFGSVLGTLLVGFVLLPSLGTRSVLLGLSGVLLGLSALVAVHERGPAPRGNAATLGLGAVAVLGILAGAARATPREVGPFEVLSDAESLYGRVRVVDESERGLRWMLVDASAIGGVFAGTEDVPFPYLYVLETLGEIRREARSALVIGLGAGYLPRVLAGQGMTVDVIEIDPEVVRAARMYFGFTPPGELRVGDARYEVRALSRDYDLVVHDCFTGGEMPWHLFSAEMVRLLRDRLTPDGVLAVSFYGLLEGREGEALSSVAATLDAEFPHRLTLAPAPGRELFDRIFLVSASALELPAGPPTRSLSAGGRLAFDALPEMVVQVAGGRGLVVTDDWNPLERMQLRKGEAYREWVVGRFGVELLSR
jgi:predicted membrane-bound spermidine synthase